MSRIAGVFAALAETERTALIPYLCAGDPGREATVPLMHAAVRAGADIIELGVPFSDPMADGPVVQRAAERGVRNGVTLVDVLAMVGEFRRSDASTPVVLMGYANPVERFEALHGSFAAAAQRAGVDGVLVVDYPAEESHGYAAALQAVQVDPIFLVAPTTTAARMKAIASAASGYIYYVSLRGTTGSSKLDTHDVAASLPALRALTGIPIAVGFGIRDADSARAVAEIADGVVIGSRLIEEIEAHPGKAAEAAVEQWLGGIRAALDIAAAEAAPAASAH
ncbi:tryptophan synthase subunit alpha [soil metagenome]